MSRSWKALALPAVVLFVVACGDSAAPSAVTRMDLVSGDEQPGFAGIPLDERLVVRVADVNNVPVPNAQVSWAVTMGGGSVAPVQSQSDNNGIARTTWTLGLTTGPQEVTATINDIAPITFSATAAEIGPTCAGTPLQMTVGGAVVLVGPQAAELCVAGDPFVSRDFVVVAFNSARGQSSSAISYGLTGTGTSAATGPPSPSPDAASPFELPALRSIQRDHTFDALLRDKERSDLAPLVRGGRSRYSAAPSVPGPAFSLANPIVGETIVLNANANSSCESPVNKNGRVVAVSQHAVVIEDIANPTGGFTSAEYQELAQTFDTLVHPVDIENFGDPSDIDHNNRIVLFYTVEVNKLTAIGSPNGFIAGFFFARDLFPKQGNSSLSACASSNQAEMMYLMVPDPAGTINGNPRSKTFVKDRTTGTLAHEMQHLINSSRRLYINDNTVYPERPWVEEGLAHSAEELLFFKASGLSTGQNLTAPVIQAMQVRIDAFNEFQSENLARIQGYLGSTNINWPFKSGSPDLDTRGAAAWFFRYVVDRMGGTQSTTWRALVNSPDTGMKNLEGVIHADPMQWMRDWSVALYVDDVVAGVSGRYRFSSWNLRSIVSGTGPGSSYQLAPLTLFNGSTRNATLQAAGSAHYRFGVPINGQGRLALTTAGTIPTTLGLVVVRTR